MDGAGFFRQALLKHRDLDGSYRLFASATNVPIIGFLVAVKAVGLNTCRAVP